MRSGRLFLLLMVVLVTARLGQMAAQESLGAPGAGQTASDIIIAEGGSREIAATLVAAGVIQHPVIFRLGAFFTRGDGKLRAGEFLFPARASLGQILDILRHGPEVEHHVTIPEGLTGPQIAVILNAAPLATGQLAPPADGSVLPQTYDYLWNTPRAAILRRAQEALRASLAAAWAKRAPNLPLATPAQAVILASIVQAETPLPGELPKVAAVYENRLRANMRLQADPTVIYAITNGQLSGGTHLTHADLATASPYNTYANPSLPPGPICAPGMAAINAVLHPANSNALYFVATGTGGHTFSHLFKDQLRAIQHLLHAK